MNTQTVSNTQAIANTGTQFSSDAATIRSNAQSMLDSAQSGVAHLSTATSQASFASQQTALRSVVGMGQTSVLSPNSALAPSLNQSRISAVQGR